MASGKWTRRISETHRPVIAPRHQAGCHAPFPLAHTAVAKEVVAVHHGQLAEEELNGALTPALLGTLPLHGGETLSPPTGWGHGTGGRARESYLLQQVSDELLVAPASLAALPNVGGRHQFLAQAEVFTVHC